MFYATLRFHKDTRYIKLNFLEKVGGCVGN